ncbi:MAG: hypothetical protein AAF703_00065 [Cyanobacteria bacterium P01_D01_bin.105]
MPLQTLPTINSISIPVLLDWWQQRKRVASARVNLTRSIPKSDETYLKAYYRLMEVYSVVKSGGVQAQTEAVQAFAERESSLLHQRLAEIEADANLSEPEKRQDKAKIQQELDELRSANDWRLKALTGINPDEEAMVKQYLSEIESVLMQVKFA